MNNFKNKYILITGGVGFIGSNLAIKLIEKGARVTVVDNMVPHQGGNIFNLETVKDKISMDFSDIRDMYSMDQLVRGKDFIFHLARQTDHILSQIDPFPDIDVNVRGTAVLLESCKKYNPAVRLIYTGTRGQYGKQVKLPVSETAPTNPRGIYEITNLTAEKMFQVYNDVHGLKSIMLRLTNIYGPRSQMKTSHYGVVNWLIRLAMDGKTIPIFGDGRLKRDFLYIDDTIEAILAVASSDKCYGEIINIGKDKPDNFRHLAEVIIKIARSGSWELTPFTPERAAQEPGDFYSNIRKIRQLTGWKPSTDLEDGIRKTIAYYKKHKGNYW